MSQMDSAEREGAVEPQWLDDDEQRAWRALAVTLVKLPTALDAQLQRDSGLSHFEYMVLAGLSEVPNRTLRMSELAVIASGSLSRLSHVVKRLEQRGWVRREPCPGDGRATNAVLTDEGWEKILSSVPGHIDTVRELVIEPLTRTQLAKLREICERINQRIDPDEACLASTSPLI